MWEINKLSISNYISKALFLLEIMPNIVEQSVRKMKKVLKFLRKCSIVNLWEFSCRDNAKDERAIKVKFGKLS